MKKLITTLFILFAITPLFNPTFAASEISEYINLSFWEKFNDDILINNLIKVYENNHDLKMASLKVNEAQKIVKMSFANELPSLGFEGYMGRIFKSSDEVFGSITIPNFTETHYYLPLTMNYEVDIWGKNHLKTKSKKKQFETIKQDERSAYIYITSAFAADYFNLIRYDKLIEYQKELISLQQQVINSYKIRFDCGLATLFEIDEANKNLTYLKEDLHKLLEKQDTLKNQISLLLADRSFKEVKRSDYETLNVSLETPDSIDFNMLDKRPDRIKSELDLERIGIDIKVAKRELLPKFIITGNIGFNMYNLSSSHKFLADLGLVPAWDLFMGERKVQLLKLKKDQFEIMSQNYEKTILIAIQETNDALYNLKNAKNIKNIVYDRLNSDIKELEYTKIRQKAGIKNDLDIILQKEKLLISKKQAVSSEINQIISAINMYQALGGIDYTSNNQL